MTPDERRLYDRIETYISRYYNAYTAAAGAQRALGFIMTVYRRRLTSSFLAIERSLRRRLDGLLDHASAGSMLDADDVVALEASGTLEVAGLERPSQELADEVAELRGFLDELAERPPDESKMERLHDELDDAFRELA